MHQLLWSTGLPLPPISVLSAPLVFLHFPSESLELMVWNMTNTLEIFDHDRGSVHARARAHTHNSTLHREQRTDGEGHPQQDSYLAFKSPRGPQICVRISRCEVALEISGRTEPWVPPHSFLLATPGGIATPPLSICCGCSFEIVCGENSRIPTRKAAECELEAS